MSTEKIKIIQQINKNVLNKDWKCLYPNCGSSAINSHLLQKNGILSQISENSHLIELVQNDYFKIYNGEKTLLFKINSINKIMSHPLFCNYHDTFIFREIEMEKINFYSIKAQSLFSYRSLCSELWKKQRNFEFYQRMKNYNQMKTLLSNYEKIILQGKIDSHELAISDLAEYKSMFEELSTCSTRFTFQTFKIPLLQICGSGVFSPISNKESYDQKNPFPIVFINIVPMDKFTFVILGKSKQYTNEWIEDYFKRWEGNYETSSELLISDLLASRIESWAVSPQLFQNWKSSKLEKLENYWNYNMYELNTDLKFNINLFN
jgi:hypothetical protein